MKIRFPKGYKNLPNKNKITAAAAPIIKVSNPDTYHFFDVKGIFKTPKKNRAHEDIITPARKTKWGKNIFE